MLQDSIKIKQIPDDYAESTGLAKYNRSKMPKCLDRLAPAVNRDGRFITGFDEGSLDIAKMQNPSEKEEKRKELESIRTFLEKSTGLDLSGTSPYWQTYTVELNSDDKIFEVKVDPGKSITFDGENIKIADLKMLMLFFAF